ncbi:MAG: zinc ribbon domain-containing protein [Phycisphaerae bacterium]|nr:zinc ribbon domain-containing protein [Phycisphaerae bacterium]
MPVFEYKCRNCGKISEFLENVTKKTKKTCPACSEGKLDRQFSVFSAGVSKAGQSKKCAGCTDHACPHSMSS